LCAPTGSGKSPITAALAKRFQSSFVITASKPLQDQYVDDFTFLKPVKGKGNFACLKQIEKEKLVKIDDHKTAIKMGLTCEKGECIEKTSKYGKTVQKNCKFKPLISDFEDGSFESKVCPYYEQKFSALISPHSIWNYSSYFQIMKFNQKAYNQYLNRKISIFDEAHKIENQIIQFIGIDIHASQVDDCGLDIKQYALNDIEMIIRLLDDMAEYYARTIKDIKDGRSYQENPDYRRIESLEKKYERMSQARIDVYNDKENFVINDPYTQAGKFKYVSVVPLDISKYVESFFVTPYQVFMSATIDKNSFCETTGMAKESVGFVDAPYSPFKLENRKIELLNTCKLSYKTPPEVEKKLIGTIDEILSTQHPNDKGLILTSSRNWCYKIQRSLTKSNQSRIRICHTSNNPGGKTQFEILKEHADSPNGVLLSSSLWEGIDLKDDLSRFQIIAKIPFPNYTEKRTALKKKRYPLWYNSQALMKLLQGFGRSIRNENDWAKTYVLDSSVQYLFEKTKDMIPKSYHDVLEL